METFEDKVRAWFYASGVHIVVLASLFFGLWFTERARPPIAIPGAVIDAELVGPVAAPRASRASRAKPTPKPAATPTPTPVAPPQPQTQANRDQIDREKVAEMAQEKAAQEEKVQQEKHRQEQQLLDEQKKEQEARDRAKLLEQVKRERAELDKKLKLEKEKLAQLNDLSKQQQKPVKPAPADVPEGPKAVTGMNGQDNSLAAQYYAAIQKAITDNWLRPDTTQAGLRCVVRIVQIPGGDVIGVQISSPCNADGVTRNSLEQAVKRAAPLPYKGYESVFSRDFNFNFTYDG